jgi:hypothetical protein
MADQYGYPVVDIYVDSVPPQTPRPEVLRVSTNSVAFTWNPVVDLGDGAGADYFVAGMDHYTSWVTMNARSQALQLLETVEPRIVTQAGMSPLDVACIHVQAFDKVGNASPDQWACSLAPAPCRRGLSPRPRRRQPGRGRPRRAGLVVLAGSCASLGHDSGNQWRNRLRHHRHTFVGHLGFR